MRSLLILPSPLLPAIAYAALAAELRGRGVDAALAPATLAPGQGPQELIARWSALLPHDAAILAHSNAGYLAPAVRSSAGREDVAIVFVDAALPPAAGSAALAPSRFRDFLRQLPSDDGRLPPWTRWWPESEMAQVIPARLFAEIDAACPRLPLDYFDAQVPAPPGWASGPNSYLAFGDTYAAEFEFARRHGWPQARVDGSHLHFLHNPVAVAEQVLILTSG